MKTLLILLLLQHSVFILTMLPKMPSESEINPAAWSQYEQTIAGCETVIARPIAAYIISVLAAEGILAIEGVWSGMLTFGVGAAIAIAVDVVANKISQSTLKPKIEQALQQRRRETLAVFRKNLISRMTGSNRMIEDLSFIFGLWHTSGTVFYRD